MTFSSLAWCALFYVTLRVLVVRVRPDQLGTIGVASKLPALLSGCLVGITVSAVCLIVVQSKIPKCLLASQQLKCLDGFF